jgi:uncharacterized protein YllA (UPF0747 family)
VVAYVGGPAEIGYLAQVAPLYALFGARPSIAAPRARFRLLDSRSAALLRSLSLTPAEVEVPRDQLLSRLGARMASGDSAGEIASGLLGELPARIAALAAGRPALARAAVRTQASVARAVTRFATRHARQIAEQDRTLGERADRLQQLLFPDGKPQERVHSLPFHAARHGLAQLKAAVIAAIAPGSGAVQDLSP